jgi:hypothetical protein
MRFAQRKERRAEEDKGILPHPFVLVVKVGVNHTACIRSQFSNDTLSERNDIDAVHKRVSSAPLFRAATVLQ